MKRTLIACLLCFSSALAAPPEAYFGPGLSSGATVDLRLEGGVRVLRFEGGIFGLEAAVESALDLSSLRGLYLGGMWRQSVSDALELGLGFGVRASSLSPFKAGLYTRGTVTLNFAPVHLKPWIQYGINAQDLRLGVTLEYQIAPAPAAAAPAALDSTWNF